MRAGDEVFYGGAGGVSFLDGSGNRNVFKGSSTNPYGKNMWKRMAKIHLTCVSGVVFATGLLCWRS